MYFLIYNNLTKYSHKSLKHEIDIILQACLQFWYNNMIILTFDSKLLPSFLIHRLLYNQYIFIGARVNGNFKLNYITLIYS